MAERPDYGIALQRLDASLEAIADAIQIAADKGPCAAVEDEDEEAYQRWKAKAAAHDAGPELLKRARVVLDRLRRNDERGRKAAVDALAETVERAEGRA